MSLAVRHPSEGWDLPVGDRSTRPAKTPAFAGVTAAVVVAASTGARA